MRRRHGRLHQLVGTIGLVLLTLAEPWSEARAEAVERLQELRVAQIGNPGGLDCWTWTSVDEQDIMRHFVEPLFEFDREGRLHGVMAESMEMHSPTEPVSPFSALVYARRHPPGVACSRTRATT